jgi:hypothetical protein
MSSIHDPWISETSTPPSVSGVSPLTDPNVYGGLCRQILGRPSWRTMRCARTKMIRQLYASATVIVPSASTYASSGVFSSFGPLPRTPGVP